MKPDHGSLRIGRVARWQRRWSYIVLGLCALTGVAWFIGLDALDLPQPRLVVWWVGHGITGFLALTVIGAALPQHVVATWRHHRNRVFGGLAFAVLVMVSLSALALLYGPEPWHAPSHWVHVIVGSVALVAFPWHVIRGRRQD